MTRTVFVRALTLDAFIGVYEAEQGTAQPVILDVEIDVVEPDDPLAENFEDVLCYHKLTRAIEAIVAAGHIKLVETLAERVCALALDHPLARRARVRVEKPNAIPGAAGVGVIVERARD